MLTHIHIIRTGKYLVSLNECPHILMTKSLYVDYSKICIKQDMMFYMNILTPNTFWYKTVHTMFTGRTHY